MKKAAQISVAVRMRPLLPSESSKRQPSNRISLDKSSNSVMVLSNDQKHQKRFSFDKVLNETQSQQSVFEECQINQMIDQVVQGYNVTIFAYGQTGSGKTFTMDGFSYDKNCKPILRDDEQMGIIPRSIRQLFQNIRKSGAVFTVNCSFMQIYKEKIYDLLNPTQQRSLNLRWNKHEEFFVENLSHHPCNSAQEVLSFFHSGSKNKIMGSHNLNTASSRSHCILSLIVEASDAKDGSMFTCKLQLVDLAGSERTSVTGNEGEAMKESIEINKSLFTLRQVISTLSDSHEGAFIPYRDSKLTSILKQSIGGNSYCLMIACLAPLYFEENLSTLSYATQTSRISNEPVKNFDFKTKIVKNLKKEIDRLNRELGDAHQQIDTLTHLLDKEKQQEGKKKLTRNESDFISPELLSEKLHDSVKMIKDLVESNKKMKNTITELSRMKDSLEAELFYVQDENQGLKEALEERR